MDNYSFLAGPEHDPYIVETPWNVGAVIATVVELTTTGNAWVVESDPDLHGTMGMIVSHGSMFDEVVIAALDGSGNSITFGEIRRMLVSFNAQTRFPAPSAS
jgi:hypothetical protein